jgi:hypothetical protein
VDQARIPLKWNEKTAAVAQVHNHLFGRYRDARREWLFLKY